MSVQRFGWSRRVRRRPFVVRKPRELLARLRESIDPRGTRFRRASHRDSAERREHRRDQPFLMPLPGWIDSPRARTLQFTDKIDRRAQRVLRGGFTIGWIELESERHGDHRLLGKRGQQRIPHLHRVETETPGKKRQAPSLEIRGIYPRRRGRRVHTSGTSTQLQGVVDNVSQRPVNSSPHPAVSEQLCRLHTSGLRPPKHSASHTLE